VLHDPRFVDLAPAEVYATLLDGGQYVCSERTMYRLLAANQEVRERRARLRHPHYAAPELLARQPNEVWSWDITKLLGPTKWIYFYLYVMLDVFSRYVVLDGPSLERRAGRAAHPRDVRPFSEAQFKTLTYRPAFPARFGSIQDARAHRHAFFPSYNTEHHHSGLGLLTACDRASRPGRAARGGGAAVLATAYAAHPERFPAGLPHPPARPQEV
jgi:putative transposase